MNILLIQNDKAVAGTIADMIRRWGYDLDWTPAGKHVFEMIRNKEYELVLLDMSYPAFLSCSVISDLKLIKPEMKIITLTAHNSLELETVVRGLGIIYYLTKPFAPNELKTILTHIQDVNDKSKEKSSVIRRGFSQ